MYTNLWISLLVVAVFEILACGDKGGGKGSPTEPGNNQNEPVLEITNVTSPETDAAIVATDADNEKLVVLGDKNEEGDIIKLTGGTYISPDNVSFTFWFGDDGLPSIAISGKLVFRFTNYTNNTVDVSLTTLDGTTVESRAVEIDAKKLRELQALWASGKISQEKFSAAKAIRAVSAGLSLGCCAANIALSLTGVGASVGVFGVVACCVGGILGSVAVITDNDLLGTGALSISALTCAIGEKGGCAKVGLAAIAKVVEEAEKKRVELEDLTREEPDELNFPAINLIKEYGIKLPSEFNGATLDTIFTYYSEDLFEKRKDTFLGKHLLHNYGLWGYNGFTGIFFQDNKDKHNFAELWIFHFESKSKAKEEHLKAIRDGIEEYWKETDEEFYDYDFYLRPREVSSEESKNLNSHEGYYFFDTDSGDSEEGTPDYMYITFRVRENVYQVIYDRIFEGWTMEQAFNRGKKFSEDIIKRND